MTLAGGFETDGFITRWMATCHPNIYGDEREVEPKERCLMTHDAADVAAIRQVLARYAASVSAGDFDAWLSLWADDGVQMPNDAPARVGKDHDCFNSNAPPGHE